jgi:hypothetical protein
MDAKRSEWYSFASTMSTRHYFSLQSPCDPDLGQLDQQCNSIRVPTYAYPQHMNVLKHFLFIQYGCGEEVSSILLWPQQCQHVIVSPHHLQPQIARISGTTWPSE